MTDAELPATNVVTAAARTRPSDRSAHHEPQPTGTRIESLDVLRGLAIFLVLGRHMPEIPQGLPRFMIVAFNGWRHGGWAGVDLFFVLSGFLVSGLLFREYQRRREVGAGRFLVRRGFKIYPGFYFLLLITAIYYRHASPPTIRWISECLFLQGYLPRIWSQSWSLAIEEHFYLLLALTIAVLARRNRGASDPFRVLVPAIIVIAITELLVRVLWLSYRPGEMDPHLAPTHLRLDSLSFGVLLGYWYAFHRPQLTTAVQSRRATIAVASAVAILLGTTLSVTHAFTLTVGFTLLYLGFGGVLLLALIPPPRPAGPWRHPVLRTTMRAAAWIGTYSYAIYLWHFAVSAWAPPLMQHVIGWTPSPAPGLAIYFVGAIGLGVVMTKLIERPLLRLRNRLVA
jgi:peptidoglycan/LPS O-acetylase OafA/YrhL